MKIIIKIITICILLVFLLLLVVLALILYFPLKLVKYIANKTNKSIRRKGNTLYVPIVEFFNKKISQRISFLGCMHIGDSSYYRTLEHIIAQSPKALVLCEGTKSTFADLEKIKNHHFTLIANLLGISTQFTMQYQDTWEFNDIPDNRLRKLSKVLQLLRNKKDGKTLPEMVKEMDEKKKALTAKLSSWDIGSGICLFGR